MLSTRRIVPVLAASLLSVWLSSLAYGATIADAATDQLIVKYKQDTVRDLGQAMNTTFRSAHEVANRAGVQMSFHRVTARGSRVFRLNKHMRLADLDELGRQIRLLDVNVLSVEPDTIAYPQWVPVDALYTTQWYLFEATGGINAQPAWDRGRGVGVKIAVVDTGVRPHQDLAANLLPGYDFVSTVWKANDGNGRDADASDPGDAVAAGECGSGRLAEPSTWHGTAVSGIIAALANNNSYFAGIAPSSRVVPVRVLGKCGGYASDIADGIAWAAGAYVPNAPINNNPARVINVSIAGPGASCGAEYQGAIDMARGLGSVVVVAAGNAAINVQDVQPANCSGVLAVAASTRSGGRASYSNFGALIKLAAPGGDGPTIDGIYVLHNTGSSTPGLDTYRGPIGGTSASAPMVSGTAVLVLSVNPHLAGVELEQLLTSTARAFPMACSGCGAGIVNADAATAAAIGPRKFFVELLQGGSTPSTWRVKNTGTVAATLLSLQIAGSGGDPAITGTSCTVGGNLAPGASCTVTTAGNACHPSSPYYLVARNSLGPSQGATPAYTLDLNCGG